DDASLDSRVGVPALAGLRRRPAKAGTPTALPMPAGGLRIPPLPARRSLPRNPPRMNPAADPAARRPPRWALVLAFALVYLSWGTTYLAIKKGVKDEHLPPALFGGVRVCLAGALLLGFLALRGQRLRLSGRDLRTVAVVGVLLFVGGNGLITLAERTVPSGA